jgi:hypothetical protein
MNRKLIATAVGLLFSLLVSLRAQDAKFVADNLKYSREFYGKVHFVALGKLPEPFHYDRYPSDGPERIQVDDGTYWRQHGAPWKHVNVKARNGEPIDHAERDRFVMTFKMREEWGHTGGAVDKETTQKLEAWVKLIDAALNFPLPKTIKLAEKSETEGRVQWVYETVPENQDAVPIRFTFRKAATDKSEHVLLHEFSGPVRVEGDKIVPGTAANPISLGFGYMMKADDEHEVSERVWEEMEATRK